MNVIGMVFAGVIMFMLIFFGLGTSQELINGANITAADDMSDNFNTTKIVTTQTFGLMGYIPYLLFITALLGVLLMLMKTTRR